MLVIILVIATLLMGAWLVLLGRVSEEDLEQAAYARILDAKADIAKLGVKEKANREKLASYDGRLHEWMDRLLGANLQTRREKLEKEIEQIQSGVLKGTSSIILPGYALQREIEAIGKSGFRKAILTKSAELYGRKYAACKTSQLLAKMLSYPAFGIAITLMMGAVLTGAGNTSVGLEIIGIGTALILVIAYGIYDELDDKVKKRRIAINKQFPNVISKLALLVTSGMIMDRAWKETAQSQETELYLEMRKTSEELDNLVSPEVAFGGFINRCNTKETAKLASAIMQNQSKGNAEIGRLLKDMAREVWQERRHTAKRDAEKANSKLMIPTMLLFLAILVMLMVPIAMNFSGI